MPATPATEIPSAYFKAKRETRIELAALYRVITHFDMTDISNQEIGARVRDQPDCFLIHPYGLLFEEVRASDLVKVSLAGEVFDGPGIWNGSGTEDFADHTGERWVSEGGVNPGRWIFGARPASLPSSTATARTSWRCRRPTAGYARSVRRRSISST